MATDADMQVALPKGFEVPGKFFASAGDITKMSKRVDALEKRVKEDEDRIKEHRDHINKLIDENTKLKSIIDDVGKKVKGISEITLPSFDRRIRWYDTHLKDPVSSLWFRKVLPWQWRDSIMVTIKDMVIETTELKLVTNKLAAVERLSSETRGLTDSAVRNITTISDLIYGSLKPNTDAALKNALDARNMSADYWKDRGTYHGLRDHWGWIWQSTMAFRGFDFTGSGKIRDFIGARLKDSVPFRTALRDSAAIGGALGLNSSLMSTLKTVFPSKGDLRSALNTARDELGGRIDGVKDRFNSLRDVIWDALNGIEVPATNLKYKFEEFRSDFHNWATDMITGGPDGKRPTVETWIRNFRRFVIAENMPKIVEHFGNMSAWTKINKDKLPGRL